MLRLHQKSFLEQLGQKWNFWRSEKFTSTLKNSLQKTNLQPVFHNAFMLNRHSKLARAKYKWHNPNTPTLNFHEQMHSGINIIQVFFMSLVLLVIPAHWQTCIIKHNLRRLKKETCPQGCTMIPLFESQQHANAEKIILVDSKAFKEGKITQDLSKRREWTIRATTHTVRLFLAVMLRIVGFG